MWRESLGNTQESEEETRSGGLSKANVNPKLLHDIQLLVTRLAQKSRQLIGNYTTNLAEAWMHVRCKFDGGKVVNRSQSGWWQHRCMGAGLQQNHGAIWGPQVWKSMSGESPNEVFSKFAKSAESQVEKQRKRKTTDQLKF